MSERSSRGSRRSGSSRRSSGVQKGDFNGVAPIPAPPKDQRTAATRPSPLNTAGMADTSGKVPQPTTFTHPLMTAFPPQPPKLEEIRGSPRAPSTSRGSNCCSTSLASTGASSTSTSVALLMDRRLYGSVSDEEWAKRVKADVLSLEDEAKLRKQQKLEAAKTLREQLGEQVSAKKQIKEAEKTSEVEERRKVAEANEEHAAKQRKYVEGMKTKQQQLLEDGKKCLGDKRRMYFSDQRNSDIALFEGGKGVMSKIGKDDADLRREKQGRRVQMALECRENNTLADADRDLRRAERLAQSQMELRSITDYLDGQEVRRRVDRANRDLKASTNEQRTALVLPVLAAELEEERRRKKSVNIGSQPNFYVSDTSQHAAIRRQKQEEYRHQLDLQKAAEDARKKEEKIKAKTDVVGLLLDVSAWENKKKAASKEHLHTGKKTPKYVEEERAMSPSAAGVMAGTSQPEVIGGEHSNDPLWRQKMERQRKALAKQMAEAEKRPKGFVQAKPQELAYERHRHQHHRTRDSSTITDVRISSLTAAA